MQPPVIEPAKAAELAERLLNALNEVKATVSKPAYEGQYGQIRDLLLSAQADVNEVVPMPTYHYDGKETTISRQGILMSIESEIERLAHLKVAAQLHLVRNETFTVEPWRVFVGAAVIIRSLLAAPNITPREEVSGDERDPTEAFLG